MEAHEFARHIMAAIHELSYVPETEDPFETFELLVSRGSYIQSAVEALYKVISGFDPRTEIPENVNDYTTALGLALYASDAEFRGNARLAKKIGGILTQLKDHNIKIDPDPLRNKLYPIANVKIINRN